MQRSKRGRNNLNRAVQISEEPGHLNHPFLKFEAAIALLHPEYDRLQAYLKSVSEWTLLVNGTFVKPEGTTVGGGTSQ